MNKSVKTIIRLNLKYIKGAYIALAAGIAALSSSIILSVIFEAQGESMAGNYNVSMGWAAWALPVTAAIIITAVHFKRITSLGGNRDNFFQGSLISYVILAAISSLIGLIIYYAFDLPYIALGRYGGVITVPEVFGWGVHGPVVFFLQQFAFLFLTAAFTHTFCSAQGKWYGWASFIGALVVLCVFLPIEPLRNIVIGYAYLIMFMPIVPLQILACLAIGLGFYWLNKPIYARKTI